MVHITWRLDEIVVDPDDDGGGSDLPVGRFEVSAQAVSEAYSDTTGLLVAVRYVLSKAHTATVVQPYTLTGNATVGSDYWKGRSETDNTPDANYFFRVNAGNTSATHYFWIVRDTLPGAPENEDVVITLVDTITLGSGVVVQRTEVEIGTPSVHTLTIVDEDVSGDRVVSFQFATITRDEGDTDSTLMVRIIIAPEAEGTESVLLSVGGATTATDGVDFDVPEATVTFADGKTFRDIPVTIHGDTDIEGDETIELVLSAPAGGAILGSPVSLLITLTNDDFAAGGTVSLGASQTTIQEGSQISVPIVFSGGPSHAGFEVNFGLVGVSSGPSGKPAGSADYNYAPPSPIKFNNGDETKTVVIAAVSDADSQEGNEDLQLRLLSITGPPEITLGSPNQRVFTILDSGGSSTYDDGDLFDKDGNRLVAERVVFDFAAPHLICHAAGTHGSTESIEIVDGFGVIPNRDQGGFYANGAIVQLGSQTVGWQGQQVSSLSVALLMAEYLWEKLHGVAYPSGPGTVPIGTDLDPVKIQVRDTVSWNQTQLRCTYRFRETQQATENDLVLNSGPSQFGIYWNSKYPTNKSIRDVCVYGYKGQGNKIPSIPGFHIDGTKWDYWVDNLRFEFVTLQGTSSGVGGQIIFITGGTAADWPFPRLGKQGKIKLYDCQLLPDPGGYPFKPAFNGGPDGSERPGAKWLIRAGAACWDIRHPVGRLPWPPCWPSEEHLFYLNGPTGPLDFPALGLDRNGTAVAANVFCNLYCPPYISPASSGGPLNWWYSTRNTQMQIAGRPLYMGPIANPGHMPSGDLALVRWDLTGHGGWINNASHAFTIWSGWNGRVYIKDCKLDPHPGSNQSGPGLYAAHDGGIFDAITGYGNSGFGPQGRWRLRTDGTGINSRTYSFQEIVIDGFHVSGDIGPGTKDCFKFNGVETLRLRKFDIKQWSSDTGTPNQLALGDHDLQTGVSFYKDLDVSDLVVMNPDGTDGAAWTGAFSDYPGWQQSPGVIYGCFKNWSHAHGSNPQFNNVTLTKADLDNLPSIGVAQTNGIIRQTYLNRLASTGDGLGTVSAAAGTPQWNGQGSAFNAQSTPIMPQAAWSSISRYIGEDGMAEDPSGNTRNTDYLYLRLQTPQGSHVVNSMCDYLLHGLSTGPGSSGTLERALQWPYQEPPAGDERWEAIGPGGNWVAGLDAVASWLVDTDGTHQYFTPETPSDPVYAVQYNYLAIRWNPPGSALTTGTKVFTVGMVDSGGDGPQIELPKDSGTFVELTRVGGDTATLNVVPAVDYSQVGFNQASITIDPANIPDTIQVAVIRRRKVANNDAMRLNAVTAIGYSSSDPGTFSGPTSLSWTGGNVTEQTDTVTVTILNKTALGAGDFITLTLGYSLPGAHCQAPSDGDLYTTFTIQFDTSSNEIEWQGSANPTVNDGDSLTLTASFQQPVTENVTVTVALSGDAIYGTHYTTVPSSPSGTVVFLNFPTGTLSKTLVVNTSDVDQSRIAQFRITDAETYGIGNKDTVTVTILDSEGAFEPFADNTGLAGAGLTDGDMQLSLGSRTLTDSAWNALASSNPANFFVDGQGWKQIYRVYFTKLVVQIKGVFLNECRLDGGYRIPNVPANQSYVLDTQALAYHTPLWWLRARYCDIRGGSKTAVGGNMWLQRCKFRDSTEDHLNLNKDANHSIVEECFFTWPMGWKPGDTHADAIQYQGVNSDPGLVSTLRVIGCKFDWWLTDSGPHKTSAAVIVSNGTIPHLMAYFEIRGCWLYGHTVNVGGQPNGDPDGDGTSLGPNNSVHVGDAPNFQEGRIVDCIFSDAFRYANLGTFGPSAGRYIWNNRWADASHLWRNPSSYAGQTILASHTNGGFQQDASPPPDTTYNLPTPSP